MPHKNLLYASWTIALFALLGSLYFSEILRFPPCVLCWYQRIFMYPLLVILLVGIYRKDSRVDLYVLPLALLGLATAFYQNLLYYGIISESFSPCAIGVSCTAKYINWLGFITIPLLSFGSFVIITFLMLRYRSLIKRNLSGTE